MPERSGRFPETWAAYSRGVQAHPAEPAAISLHPGVGLVLAHVVEAPVLVELPGQEAGHQARRDPGVAQQYGRGGGEIFAIALAALPRAREPRGLSPSFMPLAERVARAMATI